MKYSFVNMTTVGKKNNLLAPIQNHTVFSFHQERYLFDQIVRNPHKKQGSLHSFLPQESFLKLFSRKNSWSDWFLKKAYLGDLPDFLLNLRQALKNLINIFCFFQYNTYKVRSNFFSFAAILVILSACSTPSEIFDSEPGPGVGAKSISQVNHMLDTGALKAQERLDFEKPTPAIVLTDHLELPDALPLSSKTVLRRTHDQHIRVWIAPFQDTLGNFHEGMGIHTVLRPAYWQLSLNPSKV